MNDSQFGSGPAFPAWLADMHPRLSRFVDFLLPPSVTGDFTRESLVGLEAYLLEQFPDPEQYYSDNADLDFVDGAVRYVGETYLRAYGGGWHFSEDVAFVMVGRPFVLLGTPDATPISPYSLMGAALHRRTGRVLAKVYDGQARAIADQQDKDPGFHVEPDAVPGVHVPAKDQQVGRTAGADHLERWLAEMAETLFEWSSSVVAQPATLDGTTNSLPALEQVVLGRLSDTSALDAPPNAAFVKGAVYYLGHVFHEGAGGEWRYLPGEPDPRLRLVGRPYLERVDADGDPRRSVPSLVLRSLVRKRTPGAVINAYRNYAG